MSHARRHRGARTAFSLVLAALLWLPLLHLGFERSPDAVARPLADRQLAQWTRADPAVRAGLRRSNPEWDLMHRTFSVLAFANLALGEPTARARYLHVIDGIIEETLHDDTTRPADHFLLPYGRGKPLRDPGNRSLFVDGEVALMLAARRMVEPHPPHEPALRERIDRIVAQIERGPKLLGESYPDEVWVFCNVVALAAVRMYDVSSGSDHEPLFRRWVTSARAELVDPVTGLLVSKTTWNGVALDGPEGSTLWLVAHMLLLVDEDLARDQYVRARHELGGELLGFGWAREWPASWQGPADVDSGPTMPLVEANAGSSGFALLGARSFGDVDYGATLLASLELAGFPIADADGLRYAAGNALADSVILYALVSGPLWERVGVGRRGAR